MSVLQLFKPTFRVVKLATGAQTGSPYQYARPARSVMISATSAHLKDILAVLNSDISLGPGETLELLSVSPVEAIGTEGAIYA